jgi:tetratricopeptide (TPR) repeat protein
LERGQVREALAEYDQCLKLNPGRLNSLYGAGLALERSGDRDGARKRYADLAAMVAPDANRPEIAHARQYLAGLQDRRQLRARRKQRPTTADASAPEQAMSAHAARTFDRARQLVQKLGGSRPWSLS